MNPAITITVLVFLVAFNQRAVRGQTIPETSPHARASDKPQRGSISLRSTSQERQEQYEAEEAISLAKEELAKYVLIREAEDNARLELREQPVMRWTNSLERRFYGDLFLWTDRGCPAVIASMTNVYGRYHAMETEAHSLSRSKLRVTRDGERFWHPQTGVLRHPIPEAPMVADSAVVRLQQMRGLARRFSATSTNKDEQPLRLLPQPIYRYESTHPEVEDGAIFVFAVGTDPEALLLVEVLRRGSAKTWQYAIVRFNGHVKLVVLLDKQQVWSVPSLSASELKEPSSPYITFRQRFPAGDRQR